MEETMIHQAVAESRGWLVNDCIAVLKNSRTIWQDLLTWFPNLEDKTNGYTEYTYLADLIDRDPAPDPAYIIRNATFFRPLHRNVKTISLLQDCYPGPARAHQLEVCRASDLVIFNSEYTAYEYRELSSHPQMIIPIGVDTARFYPMPDDWRHGVRVKWGITPGAICWIGSTHQVKGWTKITQVIRNTGFNFVLVMKDTDHTGFEDHPRVKIFRQIPHEDLAQVINACALGLCTSVRETQHMAGLEMGMCGLPLVTTQTGAYWGRPAGPWGEAVDAADIEEALARQISYPAAPEIIRNYWISQGFTQEKCRQLWTEAIAKCLNLV